MRRLLSRLAQRRAPTPARPFTHAAVPRPPRMSPREYEAYQLFVLAEAGIDRVGLAIGADPAPECEGADAVEMSVEDAMRLAPIPHRTVPEHRCHCTYRPVVGLR